MLKRIFTVASLGLLMSQMVKGQDCEGVFTRTADKFKNKVTFDNPGLDNISFVKTITPQGARYYISLRATGSTINVREKGVTILLSDKTKILRSQEVIDVEPDLDHTYGSGDYSYSAFCTLTLSDINRISKKGITDFELYIYDFSLSDYQKEKVQQQAGCIVALK